MNELEKRNYNLVKELGGNIVKEYRAFEGDYRVIVRLASGEEKRYFISSENMNLMPIGG